MICAKFRSAILATLAAAVVLSVAWLAQARQADGERREAEVPAARQESAVPSDDLQGRWFLRSYPGGQALALIEISGPAQQAHATLLSVVRPEHFDLAGSKVDRLRIAEDAVRFTLELRARRPGDRQSLEVVAYRSKAKADPAGLWGAAIQTVREGRAHVFPSRLERTDRKEIDDKEALASSQELDDLRRFNQTKDPARQREVLEGMVEKYKDSPMAPLVAWCLAINRSDARASEEEVRALIDLAARSGARYGREMEIGAINVIVDNLAGAEGRERLVVEYGRKAVAMLHQDDPATLQVATLTKLATALRKAAGTAGAQAEAEALEGRIARLGRPAGDRPVRAEESTPAAKPDRSRWARSFAAAREEARTRGKLIMVDFYTQTCVWCKRLDSDVFPSPAVADALGQFVPVKVDAEDGEGRPLVERYRAHIQGYPAILFLDPAIDDPKDGRIVGKIPGFMPPTSFLEQLNTIACLPKDLGKLQEHRTAHPEDMDALRQLVTALAMQGRSQEAAKLAELAKDAGTDPSFDRWASVYSTLGDELMLRMSLGEAAGWFDKAARVAKRPIDVYNARIGAGLTAAFRRKGDLAAKELEAAARVAGVGDSEHRFAKEMLGNLVKPLDGSGSAEEASAALRRLDAGGLKTPGDKLPSAKPGPSSTPR